MAVKAFIGALALSLSACVAVDPLVVGATTQDWRYGEPPADCYRDGLAFAERHDVRIVRNYSVAVLNEPGRHTPPICGEWSDGVAEGCIQRVAPELGGYWLIYVGYDARDPALVERHEVAHLVCDHG